MARRGWHPTVLHLALIVALSFLPIAAASASSPQAKPEAAASDVEDKPSPQEIMSRRFPQPIRVGDLIGVPVLDYDDITIGHVSRVVRTAAGEIVLIVPYGGLFRSKRPVPVPIETVAILGRQITALEFTRDDFVKAAAWNDQEGRDIQPDETIRIAIGRR